MFLRGRAVASPLLGENLRPLGEGLPHVPPHAEAPSRRGPHHSADAPKRGGSLGVH